MKYEGVCIAVNDVNLAREFYEDLFGLEVFQDYGINIAFSCGISLQQNFAWLVDIPEERVIKAPHNIELYFEEDDFDGFLEKLREYPDIRFLGAGVLEQSWGQRTVRFYDLDGHIIEVGENLRSVVQRFLNLGMTIEETSERMDVSVPDLEKLLSR